jgi:anti-sigma regulatory factor (Ser/Thr protein kinase)
MQELLGMLMDALSAFASGAPQLDDITIVLVRRLADEAEAADDTLPPSVAEEAPDGDVIARQSFARSFASLEPIFALVQGACASAGAGEAERFAIEFTVEELFTNMVKYNPAGSGRIELIVQRTADALVCCLIDPDSDRFDVTAAPEVDIHMPVELRRPGGLGLHLVGRLVDSIKYDYSGRRSRICFRKAFRGV